MARPFYMRPVQIDKTSGNALVHDGMMYYSPNSSRIVAIPERNFTIGRESKLFTLKNARAELYYEPLWWTDAFGWLAFLPHNPSNTGLLFQRLAKIPMHLNTREVNGRKVYVMDSPTVESWTKLDSWLAEASSVIAQTFDISAVRPFSPWSLGFSEGHTSHHYALTQIIRARGWFQVWMGLMSFMIATSMTKHEYNRPGRQDHWDELLKIRGFDVGLVDALRCSTILDFSPNVKRSGVFIDLKQTGDAHPPVEWFLEYHVPVWYPWGLREQGDPALAHLAPSAVQLQRAVSVLTDLTRHTRTLALELEDSGHRVPASPVPPSQPIVTSTKPPEYIAFFAAQEARNAKRLLTESTADRMKRLNRERNPPTVSAKVFEWIRDEVGGDVYWSRQQVRKADREETLIDYGEAKRYDSFSNEWDCCEAWAAGDKSDDEAQDNDPPIASLDYSEPDDFTSWPEPPHIQNPLPRTLTPPPQSQQVLDSERIDVPQLHPLEWNQRPVLLEEGPSTGNRSKRLKCELLQQEILELLRLHYGFTPPLPIPPSSRSLATEADNKKLVRTLGLSWSDCKEYIGSVSCASMAKSYLDSILAGKRPTDDECDFNIGSRLCVAMSHRFRCLRQVEVLSEQAEDANGGCNVDKARRLMYMFDFGREAEVSWKLTVVNALDALLVCRLDPKLREQEIANYLLHHGIPFHTLLSSETAKRGPRESLPPCVLPVRLSNAQFGVSDYNNYARQRDLLLNHPRARAALMRGGYAWRLSMPIVSFATVLQGPTGWSPLPGTMFTARDVQSKEIFVDDNLTDVEFNLICGAYTCYTGYGNQTAIRSWFPPVNNFEGSGEDYGRWNGQREDSYFRRTDEINNPAREADSRGPIGTKKWRDLMRGTKDIRRLRDTLEKWSSAFIESHLRS